MIQFEIDQNQLRSLIKKIETLQNKEEVYIKSLSEGAYNLQRWITQNRLTGPRPQYLGVLSGRLRSSITAGRAEKIPGGYQARIGTNVMYAAIHEFGCADTQFVGAHIRSSHSALGLLIQRIKGYSRKMNMPARPFMRPAVEERANQQFILDRLARNIQEAIDKA